MGNYIAKQYSNMAYREPTINSMYCEAAIHEYKKKEREYCFKLNRILDAENQIYIGIGSHKPNQKLISLQAIRVGDYTNKYYRLLQFTEYENKLEYEFEERRNRIDFYNDNLS